MFQLHTRFTENGRPVSNKPITYGGNDASDLQPQTLNHFLSGQYEVDKGLHVLVSNKNERTLEKWIQVQTTVQ